MGPRLVNLQEVVLARSHIAAIAPTSLRGLYNLVRLDLSYNSLRAVPSPALGLTAQLRELSLAYNPLGRLEGSRQAEGFLIGATASGSSGHLCFGYLRRSSFFTVG